MCVLCRVYIIVIDDTGFCIGREGCKGSWEALMYMHTSCLASISDLG